jgi:DNA-directed RNA polymerase specialized sigma24 family protein
MDKELNEEAFNVFLSWLSSDRDEAGKKYEQMRCRIIIMLECRGCTRAEEDCDEALDRFGKRLPEIRDTYQGDPLPYVCVIARNVHLEHLRKENLPLPDDFDKVAPDGHRDETDELEERMHECLDKCLDEFDPTNRKLLLDYYEEEKQAKINFRKRLATSMGIAANALRLRVHRLRRSLETCMDKCLAPTASSETKQSQNPYVTGGAGAPSRPNL